MKFRARVRRVQIDQVRLVAADAAAGLVDHVGHELWPRGDGVGYHLAGVTARLALDLGAEVLVVQGAVALLRAPQLGLGARAQRRRELAVVAPQPKEAAVHRLVDCLGVGGGDEGLELAVVLLEPDAAVLEDLCVARVLLPRLEHGCQEGLLLRARLRCPRLRVGEVDLEVVGRFLLEAVLLQRGRLHLLLLLLELLYFLRSAAAHVACEFTSGGGTRSFRFSAMWCSHDVDERRARGRAGGRAPNREVWPSCNGMCNGIG